MIAALAGSRAAALVVRGADVHAKANDDWTPLDEAIQKENEEVQAVPRRRGGRYDTQC